MNIVIVGSDLTSIGAAKSLSERHNVNLIIKEKEREGILSGQGFAVLVGDIRTMNPMEGILRVADAIVFCEVPDVDVVARFRAARPDIYTVAVAPDIAISSALSRARPDAILNVSNMTIRSVSQNIYDFSTKQQTRKLAEMIRKSDRPIGIFLHNSPDPDAISSGMALKLICERLGASAKIFYGGEIGHQSNKTMVNIMGVEMIQMRNSDHVLDTINGLGIYALLDMHTPGANNVLPKDLVPHIVIDHHTIEGNQQEIKADFKDVDSTIGATASTMVKYLQAFGVIPDAKLASALLYGIRSDTKNLTKNISQQDLSAIAYLNPLADLSLVEAMEKPPMAKVTMDIISMAVQNKEVLDSYLVSSVEYINDRDVLPQAADFLLNMEGITSVLVFGIADSTLHLSARNKDPRINIADILRRAFSSTGSAGGHATAAAGQIPLGILNGVGDKEMLLKIMSEAVKKKFFDALSVAKPER